MESKLLRNTGTLGATRQLVHASCTYHYRTAVPGSQGGTFCVRHPRLPLKVQAAATLERPSTSGKSQFYVRDPAPWPTDVPIQQHDPKKTPFVDLVVAGAGPSGLAVAERVARAGFTVCIIDPNALGVWPNNYGVWVDEFQAMGLDDCLEVIWPKAKVWLNNSNAGEK